MHLSFILLVFVLLVEAKRYTEVGRAFLAVRKLLTSP